MKRYFVLPMMVLTLALFLVGTPGQNTRAEAAGFPGAENIHIVDQYCTSLTTVRITIGWEPDYAGTQWADLSMYDNGFVPGTYTPTGPLAGNQSSITYDLNSNTVYFLRINTQYGAGWVPATNAFATMLCTPATLAGTTGSISSSSNLRSDCDDLHGRWDGSSCFIVRVDCENERDRDHDHDNDGHDRDHRMDWDRDDNDRVRMDDHDHDFDNNHDRNSDDHFRRDRDFNCDFDGVKIIFRS